MKNRLYIVTGAAGHLGGTLIRQLAERGDTVRGLIMPGETGIVRSTAAYIQGDVTDPTSLEPLFADTEESEVVVIHCAGIISIAEKVTPALEAVNIRGTQNVIALCQAHHVQKLVYVSSVHAIPEGNPLRVIREAARFSPDWVEGAYAKTKASATQHVLDAAAGGLNVTVVHPSGILGPYDTSGNHMVQMVSDYVHGKLPAGIRGGYDFVDVRDVAAGCLAACEDSASGECYILSNRHYEVRELFAMIRSLRGGRRVPMLPVWLARLFAPLLGWIARLQHRRPLYTSYSLYTLTSNDRFSHDKATHMLNYQPRDLLDTLEDTIRWMDLDSPSSLRKAAVEPMA